MKEDVHPNYQDVLFVDSSTGHKFVCGSTLQPEEKEVFEGKEYPVYRVSVSSASHPFFTKSQQFIDTEGRVDKFTKRYEKQRADALAAKEKQEQKKTPVKKKAKKA